jgi:hypothetical protein
MSVGWFRGVGEVQLFLCLSVFCLSVCLSVGRSVGRSLCRSVCFVGVELKDNLFRVYKQMSTQKVCGQRFAYTEGVSVYLMQGVCVCV